jgi:hypothetical protein
VSPGPKRPLLPRDPGDVRADKVNRWTDQQRFRRDDPKSAGWGVGVATDRFSRLVAYCGGWLGFGPGEGFGTDLVLRRERSRQRVLLALRQREPLSGAIGDLAPVRAARGEGADDLITRAQLDEAVDELRRLLVALAHAGIATVDLVREPAAQRPAARLVIWTGPDEPPVAEPGDVWVQPSRTDPADPATEAVQVLGPDGWR